MSRLRVGGLGLLAALALALSACGGSNPAPTSAPASATSARAQAAVAEPQAAPDAPAPEPTEAAPPAPVGCLAPEMAYDHIGQPGCVEGWVLEVYTPQYGSDQQTYLKLPAGFQIVITEDAQPKIGRGLKTKFQGKRVHVEGTISESYKTPRIVVEDPGQLRVLEG